MKGGLGNQTQSKHMKGGPDNQFENQTQSKQTKKTLKVSILVMNQFDIGT